MFKFYFNIFKVMVSVFGTVSPQRLEHVRDMSHEIAHFANGI